MRAPDQHATKESKQKEEQQVTNTTCHQHSASLITNSREDTDVVLQVKPRFVNKQQGITEIRKIATWMDTTAQAPNQAASNTSVRGHAEMSPSTCRRSLARSLAGQIGSSETSRHEFLLVNFCPLLLVSRRPSKTKPSGVINIGNRDSASP